MAKHTTAAELARHALEQLGIRHTFGIPGVHNTELYDALAQSNAIRPMLVTHEGGGAFMADGVSRASERGEIGCLLTVPAAGFSHAMSGIGEAYLDGIPMLVLTGGVRTDTPWRHKLHQVDQMEMARGITKAAFRVTALDDVVPTIFEAYRIATSGQPGPVLVEIPTNLQLFADEAPAPADWQPPAPPPLPAADQIAAAARLLTTAQRPALFVGWGARHATDAVIALAEHLQAPVFTTLQGLASFPGSHPLHASFGIGAAAVPAGARAWQGVDALLTIGARFGEIPTGTFSAQVPAAHVHIDIDAQAIGLNYPAEIALVGDAAKVAPAVLAAVQEAADPAPPRDSLTAQIARDKAAYRKAWHDHPSPPGTINPIAFFDAARAAFPDDATLVLDDGNHTYLAAELFETRPGGKVLTPTDFNAMGYGVPAAIGARLAAPEREAFAVVGDGCFTMTGMELLTATHNGIGLAVFVFNDGTLSQIAQAQRGPYGRETCTRLPRADFQGLARAVGAKYIRLDDPAKVAATVTTARDLARAGAVVITDIAIDYSRPTHFTSAVFKANFASFPLRQKARLATRALTRKIRP